MSEFEVTMPVIVIGGGACGAVAALAAHHAGVQVLLAERDARPMGSTGMSQGLICAAGTKAQARHGVIDSAETYLADIMAKTKRLADPVIARTIAFESGPTVDWMVETLDMPWGLDRGFRPAYGNSTFRVHGWHGHTGQDMVDLLHVRLQDAGVPVLTRTCLIDVLSDDDGHIRGVALQRSDGAIERIGCDTLILASGGFAANHAMLADHIPAMATARNNGHEGSQGTAVQIGQKLGAGLGDMGAYQGYAMLTDPHGISVPPGVLVAGGILVNQAGERFTNEINDIAGMVLPVMAQPGDHVWVIYDQRIADAVAYVPEMQQLQALGAARHADSPAALASLIDAPAMHATLCEAHAAQAAGRPDALGRVWGDTTPPHGALGALKVVGAIYHTQGGLLVDGEARVLRPDGSPLPNLFAGGGAARSVSGPAHWGYLPAMGLCTAVTLGRLAGQAAARQVRRAQIKTA